jgi:hypothetical protein
MSETNYLPRICDFEVQNVFATMGAMLIEGASNAARSILSGMGLQRLQPAPADNTNEIN